MPDQQEHQTEQLDDEQQLDDLDDLDDQTEQLDDEQLDDLDDESEQLDDDESEQSYPQSYVDQLRGKQRRYRHRAKAAERRAELLARELFRSRVADTGLLADPEDLAYSDELLDDGDALRAAVQQLVSDKPHLAARRVRGDIGQHDRGDRHAGESLAGIMRRNA